MQLAFAVLLVVVLLLLYYVLRGGRAERFGGAWGGMDGLESDFLAAYSPSGNVTLRDADMLAEQRLFPALPDPPGDIDNSDLVRAYTGSIAEGSPVFQPLQQGVTPSTFAGLANFSMGEPGLLVPYSLPQTGSLDFDEVAARKQQHTGSLNKRAIDGTVRSTADLYRKYFTNELYENETNDWWDAEAAPLETDFDPSS